MMSHDTYAPVDSPDETAVFSYHDLSPPTLSNAFEARDRQHRHIDPSPLVRSEYLSTSFDADVYLKREDVLPTGSFKVRGFFTLLASLDPEFEDRGLITASTGNHGRALAYAAREFDVPATVVVPESIENPGKIRSIERMGATIIREGTDFDEAREAAERLAETDRKRFVHSGNERALIAGRAVAGLEVMTDCPNVDLVVNPVGGGSSAAAYCLTVGSLANADVIGVQPQGADAVYQAWKSGEISYQERVDTFAEGMMVRAPFKLPLDILRESLADMVVVDDDALRNAVTLLLNQESVLAEGAGAAGIAALSHLERDLSGQTIVLPISGGNISTDKLDRLLS